MLYPSVVIPLLVIPVSALSFRNGTTTHTKLELSFQWEPYGRGTIGLLTTCVVTFSLCIWTAIHPNIIPNPTGWRQAKYKMFWTAICVGLPEAIVMCAFGQWCKAKSMRKAWIAQYPDPADDIGMEGGFFVVMGGVTVGARAGKGGKGGKYNTTLTCDGFETYIKTGDINPDNFSQRAAADKGTASVLVKVLVFGQASWFVVQCISRVFYGLPATLLEVHVVIQVLYVLAAYGFWFSKPLDVNETIHIDIPSLISEDEIPENNEHEYGLLTITEKIRPGPVILGLRAFYDIGQHIGHNKTTFATALITSLNGACHAAAWNTHFPTPTEAWLWRIASLSICVVPFILGFLVQKGKYRELTGPILWNTRFLDHKSTLKHTVVIASQVRAGIGRIAKGKKADPAEPFTEFMIPQFRILKCVITLTLYFFYILCITYITLESFISVRSLPMGAYSTPSWGGYVPHIQ
ncbi:hypothetical protein Q9L58_009799 [Maublancomyces gigas]|uniref:Uncharacterized protein n=1 Tax=Discina gigas TaxID=1032678 RepID=A0ABR3G5V7_9PEZI